MKQEDQFLKYYDDYADAIFRHCYFRVFDRETARDLTQVTFIKTWEYIAKGNDIKNVRAFLYRVATNLIIDHSRGKKTLSLEQLHEEGFDPALDTRQQTTDRLDLMIIIQHLENLDHIYRETLILRFVEDFSPQEIAEITGESPNNISVRIHRGLEQLKRLIPSPRGGGLREG